MSSTTVAASAGSDRALGHFEESLGLQFYLAGSSKFGGLSSAMPGPTNQSAGSVSDICATPIACQNRQV